MKFSAILLVPALAFATAQAKISPEELMKRQCRSVHLGFQTSEAKALYTEVVPQKSAPGTYFCAIGFNRGYFGMQELANGKKVVIFSTWDNSEGDDKNAVAENDRAALVEQGKNVRVGRFGGEGTGVQSFYDYDWQLNEPTRFLVQAAQRGGHTEFTGWFFHENTKTWQLMTRFRTPAKNLLLRGGYSFIEDFRRNYESAKVPRRALFRNTWALNMNNEWHRVTGMRFTADVTPSKNIDAGPEGSGFFLETGGSTVNRHTPLWKEMKNETARLKVPEDLNALLQPTK